MEIHICLTSIYMNDIRRHIGEIIKYFDSWDSVYDINHSASQSLWFLPLPDSLLNNCQLDQMEQISTDFDYSYWSLKSLQSMWKYRLHTTVSVILFRLDGFEPSGSDREHSGYWWRECQICRYRYSVIKQLSLFNWWNKMLYVIFSGENSPQSVRCAWY